MAYEPTTWNCGDTITAEKLNKLENGLAECCGGGSTDVGYTCEYVTLTEETVTTVEDGDFICADLSYTTPIEATTIRVTFNGTVYECERIEDNDSAAHYYGASGDDWSEYPFRIWVGSHNILDTETAGTYTLKVDSEVATTTECFKRAVKSVEPLVIYIAEENGTYVSSLTYAEMREAYSQGRTIMATADYGSGGPYSPIIFNENGVFVTAVFYYEGYNNDIVVLYCEIASDNSVSVTEKHVSLS